MSTAAKGKEKRMFRGLSFAPLYFLNAPAQTPKIKQTPRAFIRSFVESNIYAVAKRKPEKIHHRKYG